MRTSSLRGGAILKGSCEPINNKERQKYAARNACLGTMSATSSCQDVELQAIKAVSGEPKIALTCPESDIGRCPTSRQLGGLPGSIA